MKALLLIALCVLGSCSSKTGVVHQPLTTEHRTAIRLALQAQGLSQPYSVELAESGWLVATYQFNEPPGSIRDFAETAVVAIREGMTPYNLAHSYRVTVNGTPPGTGLIRRYGSARIVEGGDVEWQEGV